MLVRHRLVCCALQGVCKTNDSICSEELLKDELRILRLMTVRPCTACCVYTSTTALSRNHYRTCARAITYYTAFVRLEKQGLGTRGEISLSFNAHCIFVYRAFPHPYEATRIVHSMRQLSLSDSRRRAPATATMMSLMLDGKSISRTSAGEACITALAQRSPRTRLLPLFQSWCVRREKQDVVLYSQTYAALHDNYMRSLSIDSSP